MKTENKEVIFLAAVVIVVLLLLFFHEPLKEMVLRMWS